MSVVSLYQRNFSFFFNSLVIIVLLYNNLNQYLDIIVRGRLLFKFTPEYYFKIKLL